MLLCIFVQWIALFVLCSCCIRKEASVDDAAKQVGSGRTVAAQSSSRFIMRIKNKNATS